MTLQAWIALGTLLGATMAQIAIGLFSGRLKRAEEAIAAINRSRSDEENKTQVWYGDVDIRLALLEAKMNMPKRPNGGSRPWSRS